ncbi:MAG: hypothetical protein GY753_09255 [Gammaproteobacteria bacterium]|nr:hypothetical protein [Gammaproteobacteria bacterium]
MGGLSNHNLLDVWDGNEGLAYIPRALVLLTAVDNQSGDKHSQAAEWLASPIGNCHYELLKLRQETFGDDIEGVQACANCGETLECHVSIGDIMDAHPGPDGQVACLSLQGVECRFRPASLQDLQDLALIEPSQAKLALLSRLPTSPATESSDNLFNSFDQTDLEAIDAALAEADPLADIILSALCDHCQHDNEIPLDIVNYFWDECANAAQRLLIQVHTLASSYHWSEQYILQLSASRRRFYLECVSA